jgi:hypothetical protein
MAKEHGGRVRITCTLAALAITLVTLLPRGGVAWEEAFAPAQNEVCRRGIGQYQNVILSLDLAQPPPPPDAGTEWHTASHWLNGDAVTRHVRVLNFGIPFTCLSLFHYDWTARTGGVQRPVADEEKRQMVAIVTAHPVIRRWSCAMQTQTFEFRAHRAAGQLVQSEPARAWALIAEGLPIGGNVAVWLAASALLAASAGARRRRKAERWARAGRCTCCGYDLRGNVSGRGPECGMSTA